MNERTQMAEVLKWKRVNKPRLVRRSVQHIPRFPPLVSFG